MAPEKLAAMPRAGRRVSKKTNRGVMTGTVVPYGWVDPATDQWRCSGPAFPVRWDRTHVYSMETPDRVMFLPVARTS